MAVVGYATVQLIPSLDGFTEKVKASLGGVNDTISKSTSDASDKAGSDAGSRFGGGFLKTAGSFLTAQIGYQLFSGLEEGIKGVLSAGFSDASFLQQSQKSLTVLTGSAATAKSEMADLFAFAEKTPFSAQSAVKYAQQLLGAGSAAKSIIPDLTAMGDAVSAVGGSQSDMDDAMLGFTQMMTRGTLDLQDLRQISNSGIPVFQELAKALGKPASSIQALISTGKLASDTVLPKLLAQMEKDYGGSMDAQSKTLSGEWSNLTDTINQSLGVAFTPLADWLATKLPAATAIAGKSITNVSNFFKTATDDAKTLLGAIQKVFGSDPAILALLGLKPQVTFSTKQATAAPSFIPSSNVPTDIAKPIPQATKAPSWINMPTTPTGPAAFVKPPTTVPKDVAAPKPTTAKPAASPFGSITDDLKAAQPIVDASAKLWGTLIDSGKKLYAAWMPYAKDVLGTIGPAFNQIIPIMTQAIGVIGQLVDTGVIISTKFAPVFKDVFDYIGPVVSGAFQTIYSAIKSALDLISFIFVPLGDLLTGNFSKMNADVMKLGGKLLSDLGSTFKKLGGTIVLALAGLLPAFLNVAGDLVAGFSGKFSKDVNEYVKNCTKPFSDMLTAIKKFFGIASPSKVMQQIGQWVVEGFTGGLSDKMPDVLSWASGLSGSVKGAVGNAKGWLTSKGEDALSGLSSGISTGWQGVSRWFGGLGSDITGAIGDLGRLLVSSGESLLDGFAKGIANKADSVYQAAKSALSKVANLFPHSPAPEGPFSGKGWTLYSGQSLAQGFADGITSGTTAVHDAALKMMPAIAGVNVTGAAGASSATNAAPAAPVLLDGPASFALMQQAARGEVQLALYHQAQQLAAGRR